jgi:hypothetical protein
MELTPVTTVDDVVPPVLVFSGSSVVGMRGLWVCPGASCPDQVGSDERELVLTGPYAHLSSRRCRDCGGPLEFVAVRIELIRVNVQHLRVVPRLFRLMGRVAREGSKIERGA